MPLYFFKVYDHLNLVDLDGADLVNPDAARIEAISLAGAIIKDEAKSIRIGDKWRFEVTDDSGSVLFRFDFLSTDSVPDLPRPREKME